MRTTWVKDGFMRDISCGRILKRNLDEPRGLRLWAQKFQAKQEPPKNSKPFLGVTLNPGLLREILLIIPFRMKVVVIFTIPSPNNDAYCGLRGGEVQLWIK